MFVKGLFLLLFFQQRYQKEGFPPTDLQKFLKEQKDFTVSEESSHTDFKLKYPGLCCCQRY